MLSLIVEVGSALRAGRLPFFLAVRSSYSPAIPCFWSNAWTSVSRILTFRPISETVTIPAKANNRRFARKLCGGLPCPALLAFAARLLVLVLALAYTRALMSISRLCSFYLFMAACPTFDWRHCQRDRTDSSADLAIGGCWTNPGQTANPTGSNTDSMTRRSSPRGGRKKQLDQLCHRRGLRAHRKSVGNKARTRLSVLKILDEKKPYYPADKELALHYLESLIRLHFFSEYPPS